MACTLHYGKGFFVPTGPRLLELDCQYLIHCVAPKIAVLALSPGPTQFSMLHAEKWEGLVYEIM